MNYTKQDLIDELKVQLEYVQDLAEYEELVYHIAQLEQEFEIEEEY